MYRFFNSCTADVKDRIDVERLDFSDILQQVERRKYNYKHPAWVSKLIAKREKKVEKLPCDGSKRIFFNTKDKVQEGGRIQRIPNLNMVNSCKLKDGELQKFIFHPENIRLIEKLMKKNGS